MEKKLINFVTFAGITCTAPLTFFGVPTASSTYRLNTLRRLSKSLRFGLLTMTTPVYIWVLTKQYDSLYYVRS